MSDAGAAPPFSRWERSIAFRYLRARRSEGGVALISIISFVAITLAVGALIIVMSIFNGFRSQLIDLMTGFNGHIFVVGGTDNPIDRRAMIDRLLRVPGVIQATPIVESQALVQGPNAASGALVRGISAADLRQASNVAQNIKGGSIAGFGQGEDGGNEVLVGQRLAQSLGVGPGDPISITSPSSGDTIMGALPVRKTYIVGGVFSVGMSEYDQTFIYMPLQQAQLFFGRDASVDFMEIKVADPDKVRLIKPLVERVAGPGTVVTDWTDRNHSFFGALLVERNAMRLVLLFVIFIAAMNVITGLIMLVKNKGRDIAILRTMGAGQGAVLRIFFMSGAVIGILGTVCGLLFGILFCLNIESIQNAVEWVTRTKVFNPDVYFLAHVPEKIDWSEVVIVSVFTLAASFVATLLPAWQASRIDPVEALRYE